MTEKGAFSVTICALIENLSVGLSMC